MSEHDASTTSKVYQIWAIFGQSGRLHNTMMFERGQRLGDGTLQEVWERSNLDGGEKLRLMVEFGVPGDIDQWRVATLMDAMFWRGWDAHRNGVKNDEG